MRGPTELTIRVARNWSFNTLLAGVMLDPIDERPPPYFGDCPNLRGDCPNFRLGGAPTKGWSGTVPFGGAAEAIHAGLCLLYTSRCV